MDVRNEMERTRLFRAMEYSYRQLEPYRNLVRGLVEEYAGSGYVQSSGDAARETLVNLMEQAVGAYVMALAANRPRVLVTPKFQQYTYFARQYQLAMNNLIEEIMLEETLQRAVLDAFFCVGIVKMHQADSVPVMVEEGVWMDPGVPFASNVPLDNFVYDTTATEWHKCKYSADSYRIPFADLKEEDIFDQSVVANLTPTARQWRGDDSERLEEISRGGAVEQDEFEPMIDLMDVWVPRDKRIYTFAMDQRTRFMGRFDPVAVLEWSGHEFGPHKYLSFAEVPENIIPFGPASQLAPLARLANNVLRKQGRQARRQKDIHTYTPGAAASASRIRSASDGEWVEVQDPREIGLIKQGGVDAGNQAFGVWLIDLFYQAGGNLTALLGLGAQADTVGQEEIIHRSASQKVSHMQTRVAKFTRSVIRDLGHLLWIDQAKVLPGRMEIPGLRGYSVDATWTPGDREGAFSDYSLDIDVYSMPYRSPAQRLQTINAMVTQIFVPLLPAIQQQGGTINFQELASVCAELANEPRLLDIIQFNAPIPQAMAGPEQASMPTSTRREYVRRSVPTQGSPQGQSHVTQQAWLSKAAAETQGGGSE